MKFLAKVRKIFNLNKLGNCFYNRSGKSDPRKATPHSESETRLTMPITNINLPINPIREELERNFESGINMNECIKLLSLTDEELNNQNTLMTIYEEGNVTSYSSSSEEEPEFNKKNKIDYDEPRLPGRNIFMDQGQGSGTNDQQIIPRSEVMDENEPTEYRRRYDERSKNEGSRNFERRKQPFKQFSNTLPRNLDYNPHNIKIQSIDVLDLDCVRNRLKRIDEWGSMIDVIIQSNDGLRINIAASKAYIAHKLTGNVKAWFQNLTTAQLTELEDGIVTGSEYLKRLIKAIYQEFIGKDEVNHTEEVRLADQNNARWHLDNITICDMCYFNHYACEYEKYYYQLEPNVKTIYKDIFFNKLPKPHVDKIKEMWKNRHGDIPDTLGGKIRTVELFMQDLCFQKTLFKQKYNTYNNRICCNNLNIDLPGRYGCSTYQKPKYKNKIKKYYKKKYKFRPIPYRPKYRKTQYRNKYFRKRRTKGKEKFCPTGKKQCTCWLCQEEGHYANKCPNKDKIKNNKQLKLLEYCYSMNYEPNEDSELSENEELYEVISESETESDVYSSDSE